MKLFKTQGILFFLLIHLNVNSQEIDFNVPDLPHNSFTSMLHYQSEDLFKNKLDSNFSFVDNAKNLDVQIPFNNTVLSNELLKESLVHERFKDYSEMFSNYCGPLQDGLYRPVKGEDVIVGRLMDFVINEYVVKKLIFNKKD